MKIVRVQPFLMSYPFAEPVKLAFHGGERTIVKRDAMVVRVETDNGLVGHGPAAGSEIVRDVIQSTVAPYLEGRSLSDPDALRIQFFSGPAGQDVGTVIDETTGDNEQQLAFGRGNYRLIFGGEMREGYSAIKIAQLRRTTTGQLTLADEYVPPALHIAASSWLANLLRQLIEYLVAKSRTLGERRHQSSSGQAVFSTDDGVILWVLPTVNAAIPALTHLFRQRIVHPERLYVEMVKLAGALMSLVFERHAKDLPQYEHQDLYNTFQRLDFEIRDLLERVDPKRYVPIPLVQERPALYVGRVNDEALLREAEFFLAVGANVPENKLIERVPFAIKIADRDGIDVVINNALRGVSITHVTPPGQIPTRQGLHYFRLDRNDRDITLQRFWDRIVALKTISVWVADEFPDAKLEMYAIKPR